MAQQRARFMTVAEVADILRVSTMTVYRLTEDDVDQYLAAGFNAAG